MSTDATPTKKKTRRPRANSKSGAVRAYLKRKPDAGPTEISNALKKRGIEISAAHVSNVKAQLKKQAEGEGEGANGAAPAGKRRGRKPGRADSVSLASLMEARQFVESVGGVEKAGELIDAIARLQR